MRKYLYKITKISKITKGTVDFLWRKFLVDEIMNFPERLKSGEPINC